VSGEFEILPDGAATNLRILSGHKLLQQAALDAVTRWKFSIAEAGKTVEATIEFALNCPNGAKES
jgi:TonB family protein